MPNWNITRTVTRELLPVSTPTTLVKKKTMVRVIKSAKEIS